MSDDPKNSNTPPPPPPIAQPNDDARNIIRESDETPTINITMDVDED